MKTTLVIMAAGIGSRFGGGVKQLEPVGPGGQLIIDYSLYDAMAAGFDKIVFIIRKDIEKDFREVIGERMEKACAACGVEVCYAFQALEDIPGTVPEGRTKPWGTGQAVLACGGLLTEPFAVINADDYYGRSGFASAAEFLKTGKYGLVGYVLENTLSESGGVTRGVCTVKDGKLAGIDETKNIVKTPEGPEAAGRKLDGKSLVSMNFWCFPPEFMEVLRQGVPRFLENLGNPLKDEYLLPIIADGLLKEGTEIAVLPCEDRWFGMTYREDIPGVKAQFRELHESGFYPEKLF